MIIYDMVFAYSVIFGRHRPASLDEVMGQISVFMY